MNLTILDEWLKDKGCLYMIFEEHLPGILIAIVTAGLTFYFARLNEKRNAKLVYSKTFEIIEASLDWNHSQLSRLGISLTLLKEKSIKSKSIPINEFPVNFDSSLIQASVDKLIRYEKCDEKLIKLLIFYSNHLEELNYQIKFEALNRIIREAEDSEIETRINNFFDSIKSEYVDKLELEIDECKKMMRRARSLHR